MSVAETTQHALLENLVARYEAEGFDVFVHPSRAILPQFLQECRPDAIAMRPGKNIAIEIVQPSGGSDDKTGRLQEQLAAHADWELVVLYISPGAGTEMIGVAPLDSIRHAAEDVNELRNAGQATAALVMGWSALEAAARALLPDRLARPQPAASLIEVLASEGYLTPSEADKLRAAAAVRNAAAHGRPDTKVGATQLDALVSTLRTLAGLLPKSAA